MDMSRYMDLFLAESQEHLQSADALLGELRDGAGGKAVAGLFRHVHSLKGMAATMGYREMVRVSHAMEDLLDLLRSAPADEDLAPTCRLLWEALAFLGGSIEAIRRGSPMVEGASDALASRLEQEASRFGGDRDPVDSLPRPASGLPAAPASEGNGDEELPCCRRWSIDAVLADGGPQAAGRTVRIIGELGRIGKIDRIDPLLQDSSGTLPGDRIRLTLAGDPDRESVERKLAAVEGLSSFSVRREDADREKIYASRRREPERFVRVSSSSMDTLLEYALDLVLAHEELAASLPSDRGASVASRMQRCKHRLKDLYGALMEMRLVPFEMVSHRLTVGVRDLSKQLGKQVRFEILGREVRLDRSVLESLVDPLLQLMRNALDHGIEDIETRIEKGKQGPGKISLRLVQHNDRVRIILEDDGRGLDPVHLRSAAVRQGLLEPLEAEVLNDREARLLVTLPGFSTASGVGLISGRGVGLDVVRDTVERLGGRILIESDAGKGTSFLLDLPQTLSVIQALLVREEGELYAVPISAVGRTLDLNGRQVCSESGREYVSLDGDRLEITPLQCRLAGERKPRTVNARSAALLPAAPGGSAVAVGEIVGRREILVRPLEAPLRAMRHYTGAALLEDGSVALVLDPGVLSV